MYNKKKWDLNKLLPYERCLKQNSLPSQVAIYCPLIGLLCQALCVCNENAIVNASHSVSPPVNSAHQHLWLYTLVNLLVFLRIIEFYVDSFEYNFKNGYDIISLYIYKEQHAWLFIHSTLTCRSPSCYCKCAWGQFH